MFGWSQKDKDNKLRVVFRNAYSEVIHIAALKEALAKDALTNFDNVQRQESIEEALPQAQRPERQPANNAVSGQGKSRRAEIGKV